jgi:hypothetical protein
MLHPIYDCAYEYYTRSQQYTAHEWDNKNQGKKRGVATCTLLLQSNLSSDWLAQIVGDGDILWVDRELHEDHPRATNRIVDQGIELI